MHLDEPIAEDDGSVDVDALVPVAEVAGDGVATFPPRTSMLDWVPISILSRDDQAFRVVKRDEENDGVRIVFEENEMMDMVPMNAKAKTSRKILPTIPCTKTKASQRGMFSNSDLNFYCFSFHFNWSGNLVVFANASKMTCILNWMNWADDSNFLQKGSKFIFLSLKVTWLTFADQNKFGIKTQISKWLPNQRC
jgi:hypothetical protein